MDLSLLHKFYTEGMKIDSAKTKAYLENTTR